VVEWNPPADRPRLAEVLRLPKKHACTYRFIEVPEALHRTLAHSESLPLFQMIAKNVGIRRARGQFVLATNIDILMSPELVEFLAQKRLEPGCLYRVDRCDVESNIPFGESADRVLEYCRSHQIRVNRRAGTYPVEPAGRLKTLPGDIVDGTSVLMFDGWHVLEADVDGSFRWAMPTARLLLHADAAPGTGEVAVFEIETEANPYDRTAWVEVDVLDGGRGTLIGR